MNVVAKCLHPQTIDGTDIREFLSIGAISEEARAKTRAFLNLKDETKKQLFEILIDRWMLYRIGQDVAYIKHVLSGRANVLYQIILSGKHWDGVYEFALKGKKIETAGYTIGNKNILSIKSRGNYGLAVFGKDTKSPYFISRGDFDTNREFLNALLEVGLITQKEIETYCRPNEMMEAYLERTLPQVIFG